MLSLLRHQSILNVIGLTLLTQSVFMLLLVPVAFFYNEATINSELISFGITFIIGFSLFALTFKHRKASFSIRESFLIVPLLWFIVPLFGTLPYLVSQSIPNFVNAFFESVSGFTTTGSSILSDIEAIPKSILLWRALTHWLGGLGIIVLVIAVMSHLKIGGSHLMVAEGSLFGVDKIKPRLIDVARQLWYIYLTLTVAEIICLMFAGMDLFDAACHSFATVATGGFGTKNTSVMEMNAAVHYIITIFMTLAGINFSLHYFLFARKFKNVFRDEELRAYLAIMGVITLILTINTLKHYPTVELAFRHSLFQVSSLMTCTGFSSTDYELWPSFSHLVLFFTMFIGACVGSTCGGVKVARYVLIFKTAKQMFARMISPNSVKPTLYNGQRLNNQVVNSVFAYITVYFLTFMVGTLVLSLAGNDLPTSAGGIITTLGGIGPGFGNVGPADNFGGLNDFSKLYISLNMLLGRLEIFSVLVLFHPAFRKI